jgi:hypothetical protein
LGGLEVSIVDQRADATRSIATGRRLTARDIRSLLTQHAEEIMDALRSASVPLRTAEVARPTTFREFVKSMGPFLRMN